jgi:predicted O-methyltransferase YrrM
MNALLQEILATREVQTLDNETIPLMSGIHRSIGECIQELIREVGANTTLETGLAQGISTLYICEALTETSAAPRHITIDPYENRAWRGVGLSNIKRAGYESIVEFFEHSSHRVLPELERRATKIEFALVDGHHAFEYALLDYFYIDKMLPVGGIVAFDDLQLPAIRKLCRYILNNHDYRIVRVISNSGQAHVNAVHESSNTESENSPGDQTETKRADDADDREIPPSTRFVALQKTSAEIKAFNDFTDF